MIFQSVPFTTAFKKEKSKAQIQQKQSWYLLTAPYTTLISQSWQVLLATPNLSNYQQAPSFSSFIQRVALAIQLKSSLQRNFNILQCLRTNFNGLGDYSHFTALAIQIEFQPTYKQGIHIILIEIIPITAIDNGYLFFICEACIVYMIPEMFTITNTTAASNLIEQRTSRSQRQ